ncbi:hypothetical protein P3G55_06555 [Leptospira sp. 96542]|nr:hypothetical protein [Leptospira sp. 96542]
MKKNKTLFSLLLVASLMVSVLASCTKSSAKEGTDPTLLSLVVAGATERAHCGAAIVLVNSCVGGQGTGQYVDAGICASTPGYDNVDLVKCVSAKVTELDCTNPANKYTTGAAALAITSSATTADGKTTTVVTHKGVFGACFLTKGGFSAFATVDETAGTATWTH